MTPTAGPAIRPALLSWLVRSLGREETPWSAEQSAFLDSLIGTEEGARVLASLVVTTLRLRQSALIKTEQLGPVGSVLPAIEAFWRDPSPQTYRELRIARW